MVWNLWTCVSYTQKEGELKSVGSSWPPSEVVVPPPNFSSRFLKAFWFFKICTARATFSVNKNEKCRNSVSKLYWGWEG